MLVLTVEVRLLCSYEIRFSGSSFVVRAEVFLKNSELAFEEVELLFFKGRGIANFGLVDRLTQSSLEFSKFLFILSAS